ncbi:hypothetical protein Ddye_011854 [Dipteronia dyeriana]|uniref:Ubiquitin-like protease family profile domain-containing protein n=1 Tax=Dipteronia dyeriana TaxID=168575 RepID=A0AAD9X3G5_9ROSI|nr:hypothetical protein Ddye_011854 [Dipteronia dyeriana]
MEIRLKKMQTQQYEYQQEVRDEMTSMKNEMRIGFLRLSELICKSKNEKTCHNVDTDVINLSQNNNIHFQSSTFHRVFPSLEMAKGNSEPSDDVKQLSRPSKITIKVTRDRKRSAYTVSPYIDPTAKRPRKSKMPKFGRDSPLEEDVLRSMNSWINDNNMNTRMHTGVFEANPHWFQILPSKIGWLDGDHMETYYRLMRRRAFFVPQLYSHNIVLLDYTFMTIIQGRWSLLVENKTQFKHETYKWDSEMTDYVIGKKPVEAWEHWRKVNLILFPANVNGNHWVAIAVDLKEWVITIYDSLPEINSVLEITKWISCLRKMLPSFFVHTMPDIYNDVLPFAVQRPEKDIPNQGNGSDCRIFALKFLKYLWAGKPFDFEAKDGPALRVKIATEIFKNSKQVPCNNIVEGLQVQKMTWLCSKYKGDYVKF